MRFFFYGTLVQPEILRRVLRRARAPVLEHAWAEGFERRRLAGTPFPALLPAPSGRVTGRLVRGLSRKERTRLVKYEGDGYKMTEITVRVGRAERRAWVFLPTSGVATAGIWLPSRWRLRARRAALTSLGPARGAGR